jgi:hypothetical protein
MTDSKDKALRLITQMTENLGEGGNSGEGTDTGLILDDLHVAVARLEGRIKKAMEVLTGKDAGAVESIRAAAQNKYLAQRLKARAILMQVHQKVKNSLLAAVPYRRRVSQAKKGLTYSQYFLFQSMGWVDASFYLPKQMLRLRSTPKTQLHVGFQEYASLLGAITPFVTSSIPIRASKFTYQQSRLPPLTSMSSLIPTQISICGWGRGWRIMQRLLNIYLTLR